MFDGVPDNPVARRKVFYIPGYDPIHPRRYRELYRTESAEQARISGYDIGIQGKASGDHYGWKVASRIKGQVTLTDVEVLIWSDIVRDSMSNTIPATYLQLVRTAWTYIASGTMRRLMWMRKGPVIAALYPIGMLLVQLLVALVAAWVPARLLEWLGGLLAGWAGQGVLWAGASARAAEITTGTLGGVFWVLSWALFLGVAWWVLRWFKGKDGKFYAYYLMHDYAFSARYKGANPKALEDRMAEFGDTIAAALKDHELDEVLVVGHSSGAHLAISIIADLLRARRVPIVGPELNFLSLGQVVPMVSFLPEAYRLRADLAYMAVQEQVTWVDVTAPGDGCSFALCDPVAVTGVAPEGQHWPLIMSAAFTQTLSEDKWRELRWRFFRLHFQYLCAFDRPKDYDYFQITGGPMTLSERYRDRNSSRSRIDVAASKYTALTP